MTRIRDFKDPNRYRALEGIFSADRYRRLRAESLQGARECREVLTNPSCDLMTRYSPDDPRVKKAVGFWIERARRFHAIAMGRKALSGTFVVIGHGGSGVIENPYVEGARASKPVQEVAA